MAPGFHLFKRVPDIEAQCCNLLLLPDPVNSRKRLVLDGRIPRDGYMVYFAFILLESFTSGVLSDMPGRQR
jgi:hypothetical protein